MERQCFGSGETLNLWNRWQLGKTAIINLILKTMIIEKKTIENITFLKIDSQRVVIHFLTISKDYNEALKIAKKIGFKSRKYHNKKFGGGIVFYCCFNSDDLKNLAIELKKSSLN